MDEQNNRNDVDEKITDANTDVNKEAENKEPENVTYQSYHSYQSDRYYNNNVGNTTGTYNNGNAPDTEKTTPQNGNNAYYNNFQQSPGMAYNYDPSSMPAKPPKQDDFGIVSFCLSLSFIVLLLCCCCVCFARVIFVLIAAAEIAAIVFAVISRKKMGRFTGFAIAGMIIAIIVLLVIIVIITTFFEFFNELLRVLTEPGYYVEFFETYAPEYYRENKEEVDEIFEEFFEALKEANFGYVIE